jgi:hypothetical protein
MAGKCDIGYTYSPLVGQIGFNRQSSQRMTTTKTYDKLNRLTQISSIPSAAGALTFGYNYNDANQRVRVGMACLGLPAPYYSDIS